MSEQLIIGNASHLYAVQEGWGQLPAGIQYGYTHGSCEYRPRIGPICMMPSANTYLQMSA